MAVARESLARYVGNFFDGILLGVSRWFLPQWFRELSPDQPIAVICLTAHRSPIAARQLVKAGFTAVYNITGGMMG